jgi:hypothetical protein
MTKRESILVLDRSGALRRAPDAILAPDGLTVRRIELFTE